MAKSSNKSNPKVFETVRYSIVIENTGTDSANNVVVTDLVPPGMQVTAMSPGGALSGGTITWNLGNLACQTVSVTLTAFADTSGSWGSYLDVRDSDDVRAFSDLAGAPSSSSNWFLLEGLAGYSVTSVNSVVAYYEYRNNNATDTIRAAFSNEGNMATQEGATVLPNLSASYPTDLVRSWNITGLGTWNYGTLSALALYIQHEEGGTSGTRQAWMDRVWAVANIQSCGTSVWFDAVVTNSLYNGDVVNNTANASGSNFSPVGSPPASFTVLGPELAVTKTASPSLVAQGDLVEYTLSYQNFVSGLSVFDDFNNNYGTGIVNIPAWNAVHSNPEFWRNTNGTLSHSGCGYGLAYRSDTPNFANGTVSVDILINGNGGGTGDTALVFLYQDSGPLAGRFYKSKLYSGCGGSPSGYCIDVQTSAWSQVCGNAPISSFNPNVWNNLKVVIQDYVFYVYVNNVLEFTCQDTTNWVNLPGKAGVYNDGNCNLYDNFRIGDDIQALNVRLWDTLPACVSYVSSVPAATVAGQLLSWNVGNVDGGQTGQIRYTVNTSACTPGSVVPNLASLKADNSRLGTAASAITVVLPVQKSVNPGTTSPGNTVTYSIVYTATGGGTVVTDDHNDSTYAGRWRSQRGLNTSQVTEVAGGYLQFNSNVNDEFTAYGTLGRDGLIEADVYLREGQCNGLVLGYQGSSYYTVCMFIGYSPNDDQWRLLYHNGSTTSTIYSSPNMVIDPTNGTGNVWANLKVIREANTFRIYLNNAFVMTITDPANNLPGPGLQGYYNYGGDWRFDNFRWEPGYKSGVQVWDTVPANMSFVSATQGGTLSGGVVSWAVPNLSSGQSWTAQMVLRVDPSAPGGIINNTANVRLQAGASYNSGPIPLVVSVADVSLVKSVNQGTFVLGQTATYCFAWASTGSDPANVVIWDTLHPILTYVGSTAPGNLQVLGGNNVVVWNLGSQAPGANGSVCVWARVDAYPFIPFEVTKKFFAVWRRAWMGAGGGS